MHPAQRTASTAVTASSSPTDKTGLDKSGRAHIICQGGDFDLVIRNSLHKISNSCAHHDALNWLTGYRYDRHGRLTGETRQPGGGGIYTTGYSYDGQGRLAGITYPSGRTVGYSFDGMGRINRIATSHNGTTKVLASNIAYQPFGGVQSFTYGDGLTAPVQTYTRRRDLDGRIAGYTLGGQALTLGYDAASQIVSLTDPSLPSTAAYRYDLLSRLTGYTEGAINHSYNYDPDGNRVSRTAGGITATYSYAPGSNRLSGIQSGNTSQFVAQDANGATTERDKRGRAHILCQGGDF